MRQGFRSSRLVSFAVVIALSGSGCAASTPSIRATSGAHLVTDSDRYAAAIDEAFVAYEAAARAALATPCQSELEAHAVATTLAHRFDLLLAQALRRRGLSVRGLSVHAEHHPEFAAAQERLNRPRRAAIESLLARLPDAVPAGPRRLAPFDAPPPASTLVATR